MLSVSSETSNAVQRMVESLKQTLRRGHDRHHKLTTGRPDGVGVVY